MRDPERILATRNVMKFCQPMRCIYNHARKENGAMRCDIIHFAFCIAKRLKEEKGKGNTHISLFFLRDLSWLIIHFFPLSFFSLCLSLSLLHNFPFQQKSQVAVRPSFSPLRSFSRKSPWD